MKKFFIIIFLLFLFVLVLNTCRSTTEIVPEKDKKTENPWDYGFYPPYDDGTGQVIDRMNWISAKKKLEKLDYMNDIKYIRDERTQLCFAIYKNFGFQRVPCSYIEDIIEK